MMGSLGVRAKILNRNRARGIFHGGSGLTNLEKTREVTSGESTASQAGLGGALGCPAQEPSANQIHLLPRVWYTMAPMRQSSSLLFLGRLIKGKKRRELACDHLFSRPIVINAASTSNKRCRKQ